MDYFLLLYAFWLLGLLDIYLCYWIRKQQRRAQMVGKFTSEIERENPRPFYCKPPLFGVLFDTHASCTGEFLCLALFYHRLYYFLMLCAFWELESEYNNFQPSHKFSIDKRCMHNEMTS